MRSALCSSREFDKVTRNPQLVTRNGSGLLTRNSNLFIEFIVFIELVEFNSLPK